MPTGNGSPEPFIPGRGVAPRIADHFVRNHQSIPAATVAGLGAYYGVTRSTMRSALRLAEPILATQGWTLRVPEADHGWMVIATDDQIAFLRSTIYRLRAVSVEMDRYERNEAAVAQAGAVMVFAPLNAALAAAFESVLEAVTA